MEQVIYETISDPQRLGFIKTTSIDIVVLLLTGIWMLNIKRFFDIALTTVAEVINVKCFLDNRGDSEGCGLFILTVNFKTDAGQDITTKFFSVEGQEKGDYVDIWYNPDVPQKVKMLEMKFSLLFAAGIFIIVLELLIFKCAGYFAW